MPNGDGGEVRREDIEDDEAWQRLTDEPSRERFLVRR